MNIVYAEGDRARWAEEIVHFCIAELMPRMRTLDITVDITESDACGYCLAVDKREFVIEINEELDDVEFLGTICHEMTHVKQYARGELDIDNKAVYSSQEEYENVWYEKEAYEMEKILVKKFVKSVDTTLKMV
jgi:hypothetical protein